MLMLTEPMTRKEATGAERRRGLRIRQERPVKIYEPNRGRYFGAQTCDVSTTGLRIELPTGAAVSLGEILNIHVGLSHSGNALANRRTMMPARVVWVEPGTDAGRTEAGIEFVSDIESYRRAA
jgi:c-di-GMP-binding flagellar brake protein YcgR